MENYNLENYIPTDGTVEQVNSESTVSECSLIVPACLSAKQEFRANGSHLLGHIGDKLEPSCQSGNNCMFMGWYLSYDEHVRSILRDGHPNPPDAFRACNYKTDPGKNGEGDGYKIHHLKRFLGELQRAGKIRGYTVSELKKHGKDWNPVRFFTLGTQRKEVGSRYILFGRCSNNENWNPSAFGKKRKIGTARLEECVHPLARVEKKIGKSLASRLVVVDKDYQYSKDSDVVLKQEAEMYNEVTEADGFKRNTWTHSCTVAYYPASDETSKKLWKANDLVPVLFDNGKRVSKECTAKNLMESIFDISSIYSVSIEVD